MKVLRCGCVIRSPRWTDVRFANRTTLLISSKGRTAFRIASLLWFTALSVTFLDLRVKTHLHCQDGRTNPDGRASWGVLQTGWVKGEFLSLPSSAPELRPNLSGQSHGILRLIETHTRLNSLVGQNLISVCHQSIPPAESKKLVAEKPFIFISIAS